MPQSKEQVFNDFVQFVTQHGWGVVYTRDPRQDVPSDCGFIRVRLPGEAVISRCTRLGFVALEQFGC
jgi:hypothetical protein